MSVRWQQHVSKKLEWGQQKPGEVSGAKKRQMEKHVANKFFNLTRLNHMLNLLQQHGFRVGAPKKA